LIEVTSKGIGHIAMPFQIRRIADAKAYEIERISKAIEANKETLKLLEYDNEKIKIICDNENMSHENAAEHLELTQRASNRLLSREVKRQINIENTVHAAAEDLSNEKTVSEEPVDEDWITRFFNIIEDINNEQMQKLWGRILSGEIKSPRTYSLRTLEVLRNISPPEAEIFCKVAEYALKSGNKTFILQDKKFLEEELNITFTDLLLLRDLGLLFTNDLEFSFTPVSKDQISHLIYGPSIVVLKRDADTPKIPLQATIFTQTGTELLNLVTPSFKKEYVEHVGKKLKINKDIHVFYGFIKGFAGDQILHTDLIEI